MPSVRLKTGQSYPVSPGTTLLDGALASGFSLEYSCRTGRCGICRTRLISGETEVVRPEAALTIAESANGDILTCCRSAASDVVIDAESLEQLAGIQRKTLPCRIAALERLCPDVVKVVLRFPPNAEFDFLPGQYIDVIYKGARRSYSVANAPRSDGTIELLVARYPGGVLSGYWFEQATVGDLLRMEGPFGTFFARQSEARNIVFLATGTGIAPVKAMVEGRALNLPAINARLYWGARSEIALHWSPPPEVVFIPTLSRPGEGWTGRQGYVQKALLEDGFDPSNTFVYACGSEAMIGQARSTLLGEGLEASRFLSDAFVSSS